MLTQLWTVRYHYPKKFFTKNKIKNNITADPLLEEPYSKCAILLSAGHLADGSGTTRSTVEQLFSGGNNKQVLNYNTVIQYNIILQ